MNSLKIKQMQLEAEKRYFDGELLSEKSESDSGYLLKLLGFELILKAALLAEKGLENTSHNYHAMYRSLSKELKVRLLSECQIRIQLFDVTPRMEKVLKWYQYIL